MHDNKGSENANQFILAQQKKKKLDEQMNPQKHLLPKDIFINGDRSKKFNDPIKLPFPSIDLIFNHKNIWANLQNQNPKSIKFHLHKLEDWMPLITDPNPKDEHPRIQERNLRDYLSKNNKEYEPQIDLEEEMYNNLKRGHGKKKELEELKKKKEFNAKLNGDYMKPFPSFYESIALDPPLNEKQIAKLEAKIIKEAENSIKQVRSTRNLQANIKNSQMTRTVLRKYLDFLEDDDCMRYSKP